MSIRLVFSVRKPGQKNCVPVRWIDTKGSKSIPLFTDTPRDIDTNGFVHCLSCVSESSDTASIGSFILLSDNVRNNQIMATFFSININSFRNKRIPLLGESTRYWRSRPPLYPKAKKCILSSKSLHLVAAMLAYVCLRCMLCKKRRFYSLR